MGKKLLIVSIIICSVLLLVPGVLAEEEQPTQAIGFSSGVNSGLAYKYFISPDQILQFDAGIYGSSNNYLDYNLGFMYQKLLHETERTRLYFAPLLSWRQSIDLNAEDNVHEYTEYLNDDGSEEKYYYQNSYDRRGIFAGLTYGIEYKLDRIGISCFAGYGGYLNWDYSPGGPFETEVAARNMRQQTSYGFELTGGISLFYYFN